MPGTKLFLLSSLRASYVEARAITGLHYRWCVCTVLVGASVTSVKVYHKVVFVAMNGVFPLQAAARSRFCVSPPPLPSRPLSAPLLRRFFSDTRPALRPSFSQGVPKIPTKYYKRSSTRRSNNDLPEMGAAGGGGSMADIFSGAYTSNGSGGGLGSGSGGDKSSHGVEELNGLTWQGDHGFDDSGSGISGSGGINSSGGMSSSGGGGDMSPRRRSYLWKRPTSKPSAGITTGAGQNGTSSNSLFRPKSAAATATGVAQPVAPAALDTGVANELFDASFYADRREDQGAASVGGGAGERGEGGAALPTAVAAVESEEGSPRRAMLGGGGGAVQLIAGITDGGEDHRFRVRGASFLDDGLEVRNIKVVRASSLLSLLSGLAAYCLF